MTPDPGYEAALAAALGDDLNAALDPEGASALGRTRAAPPAWPEGATPLAPLVKAPPELAARLAFTALVDAKDAARLVPLLAPGARLASREGDLWRWDDFSSRGPMRPKPAAVRLQQRRRLADIEAEIDDFARRHGGRSLARQGQ